MALRTATKSEYELTRDAMEAIARKFSINKIEDNLAFQKTLLLLAGINEKLDAGIFYADPTGELCNFAFPLSKSATTKLIIALNEHFPSLEAKIIKKKYQNPNNSSIGKPINIIQMNAKILRENVLPVIEHYFLYHPDPARNDTRALYPYTPMFDIVYEMFKKEGININKNEDCFPAMLYLLVMHQQRDAQDISLNILLFLPNVLTKMVLGYLNLENLVIKDHKKMDAKKNPEDSSSNIIKTLKCNFNVKSDDGYATTFNFTISPKNAVDIADYLNQIIPNSAKTDSKPVDDSELKKALTVNVNNRTLVDPGFLSDLLDILIKLLPQELIDQYRKDSFTITWSTKDCIGMLQETLKTIADKKENPFYTPFQTNINNLIIHLTVNGLENKKNHDKLKQLINHLKSSQQNFVAALSSSNVSEPPTKKQRTRLFSINEPDKTLEDMDKLEDVDKALEGIDVIANKRW